MQALRCPAEGSRGGSGERGSAPLPCAVPPPEPCWASRRQIWCTSARAACVFSSFFPFFHPCRWQGAQAGVWGFSWCSAAACGVGEERARLLPGGESLGSSRSARGEIRLSSTGCRRLSLSLSPAGLPDFLGFGGAQRGLRHGLVALGTCSSLSSASSAFQVIIRYSESWERSKPWGHLELKGNCSIFLG